MELHPAQPEHEVYLAAVMGLKANLVNATFATIIPGLAAGRYDMGASSFSDTPAREKSVDFVDYAQVGESFYTKAAGGTSIGSIADICGKTVSVESGIPNACRKNESRLTPISTPGIMIGNVNAIRNPVRKRKRLRTRENAAAVPATRASGPPGLSAARRARPAG